MTCILLVGLPTLRLRVEPTKISKLMIGFDLLAIGLLISIGAWNTIQSYQIVRFRKCFILNIISYNER